MGNTFPDDQSTSPVKAESQSKFVRVVSTNSPPLEDNWWVHIFIKLLSELPRETESSKLGIKFPVISRCPSCLRYSGWSSSVRPSKR